MYANLCTFFIFYDKIKVIIFEHIEIGVKIMNKRSNDEQSLVSAYKNLKQYVV